MIRQALICLVAALVTFGRAEAQIGAVGSPPAVLSAQAWARVAASGWDTSHAGTALDLTGYTLSWDKVPSDCSKLGWETFASQPGKDLYANNGVSYFDELGHLIYGAPGSASASNWTGISPFSCSGAGLAVTLSYDAVHSRWQSGVVKTMNAVGEGQSVGYGYIEMTATAPAPTGGIRPQVAEWASSVTQFATPSVHDEIDLNETYIANGSDATAQQTTMHRWPDSTPPLAGDVTQHSSIQTNWTGAVLDGNPHRFGLKKTPTLFIVYTDASGSMAEVGRFPVLSKQDQVAVFGLFSVLDWFDISGVSTAVTYTATLNRIMIYSCSLSC